MKQHRPNELHNKYCQGCFNTVTYRRPHEDAVFLECVGDKAAQIPACKRRLYDAENIPRPPEQFD